MNRRKFLTILGSAGVASALGTAKVANAAGTVDYPYYENSYGVLHDTTRCIGCRQCEAACQKVNELPMPKRSFDDLSVTHVKRRTSAAAWTVVNRYQVEGQDVYRKLQCLHCNDPACASACFAKCFTKNEDGSVSYNGDQCVGCRYCMIACPFYAPGYQYEEAFNPLVLKCTFCRPRLQEGKLPGCVEGCPMDALTFGKRSTLLKIARNRIEKEPDRYVDYVYGETDAGGTAWMTLSGVDPEQLGQNTHLGNRPIGELTSGALGAVPMIIGFWPVLFAGAYGITKLKEAKQKAELKKMQEDTFNSNQEHIDAALAKLEAEQGTEIAEKVKKALEDTKAHGCCGGQCACAGIEAQPKKHTGCACSTTIEAQPKNKGEGA